MLYCGAAKKCITPAYRVYLAGYAARWGRLSEGVHDDIFCRAFFFSQNEKRMLMIFLDVEGLTQRVLNRIQKRIREELHIAYVSVSCTHTHSAPHTYAQAQLEKEELDIAWLSFMQDQVFEAAREAAGNVFRAKIGHGRTEVPDVAKNRRAGHFETDPDLFTLVVRDIQNVVRGVIVTYSCHCTVLDASNFLISSDYPGALCDMLEQAYPMATAAFSNGAAGDINIGYSSDASALGEAMPIRTFQNARRIAKILCESAARLIDSTITSESTSIGMRMIDVDVPLREDMPALSELWAKIGSLDQKISAGAGDTELRALKLQKIYIQCFILRLAENLGGANALTTQSAFIRFGDLLYITIPGELFTSSGLALKEHFSSRFNTAVLCYSNGYIGYIPPIDAMLEGGYEAETSIFAVDVAEEYLRQLMSFSPE